MKTDNLETPEKLRDLGGTDSGGRVSGTLQSEGDILLALRDHFNPKEYVVLPQVRNGAGFNSTRTADALVMSTWPSRGLNLYGVEIKVSRGDWLRERGKPEKADEIAAYCDYWFLAVGHESIVKDQEVPVPWGLLVPGKKPGTLKVMRAPTKLEAKPMSRSFLATILRKTLETVMPLSAVDAEIERRVNEKVAVLEDLITRRITKDLDPIGLMEKNGKLLASVQAFKDATGIWIDAYDPPHWKRLARTLKLLEWNDLDRWLDALEGAVKRAHDDVAALKAALSEGRVAK